MAYLEWDTRYSVNHPLLDQHHKKLFDILNKLHDLIKEGQGSDAIKITLKELFEHTQEHFEEEEKFLMQIDFPHLEEHKGFHKQFFDKLKAFEKDVAEGHGTFAATQLLNVCIKWLHEHILKSDAEYAKLAKEHLIEA